VAYFVTFGQQIISLKARFTAIAWRGSTILYTVHNCTSSWYKCWKLDGIFRDGECEAIMEKAVVCLLYYPGRADVNNG